MVSDTKTRKVFHEGQFDKPDPIGMFLGGGTSDLAFCKDLQEKKIFEKTGWDKFQKMKYPILIDTSIFVKHIDQDGTQWPLYVPKKYAPKGTKF